MRQTKIQKKTILSSEVKAVPRIYRSEHFTLKDWKRIDIRKRNLDIAISLFGLFFLSPFLLLIAVIIKMNSSGPVFFKQMREGEAGKPFLCYKFRTMHTNSQNDEEKYEPNVTKKGDNRIFKFGHFLRKTNLDEIPQLYNVLKGEMSLIGPRPYMISESLYWKSVFHNIEFELREQVKPGISGLAQINGYRGGILDKKHMRKRLEYDIIYVQSYTTNLDIMIISKTVLQMIFGNTRAH